MNTNIAQPTSPDRNVGRAVPSAPPTSSEPHDFNMDAVIANNFGQGDDHRPTFPMNGSPWPAQLRAAASNA